MSESILPSLTILQSRRVDEIAIEKYGFSSLVLMENAARGAADIFTDLYPPGRVVFVCGKGNNGGDGLAMARHLESRGYEVIVELLAKSQDLTPDAAANYQIISQAGFLIRSHQQQESLVVASREWNSADVIVDAMLGTGATGEVREPYASAISLINTTGKPVVAIDVPSGLDADSGQPGLVCIKASQTLTFVSKKIGFEKESASDYLGHVFVVSLGLPGKLLGEIFLSN